MTSRSLHVQHTALLQADRDESDDSTARLTMTSKTTLLQGRLRQVGQLVCKADHDKSDNLTARPTMTSRTT